MNEMQTCGIEQNRQPKAMEVADKLSRNITLSGERLERLHQRLLPIVDRSRLSEAAPSDVHKQEPLPEYLQLIDGDANRAKYIADEIGALLDALEI